MLFNAPDNLVELNYNQPPHLIEFYQNIMCVYLGIMGEVIHNIDENPRTILKYAQTSAGKSRLSQSFYGQHTRVNPPKSFTYELIDVSDECWTPGCSGTYFIFRVSPTEYAVVFNVGHRERIANTELTEPYVEYFIKFVGKFLGLIASGAERVLFCGHSNGMVSATLTSFMLMCLSDATFASEFADSGIMTHSLYANVYQQYDPSLFFGITDSLCVCGTGAYPILFSEPEMFNYYFQTLNGRYLHVGLGLKQEILNQVDLWVDYYMRPHDTERRWGGFFIPSTPLYNFLYHVYSYPYGYFLDTVRIKKFYRLDYTGHINRADPDLVEYEGINAGTGFFENDYESELHMFNFYRVLLSNLFC